MTANSHLLVLPVKEIRILKKLLKCKVKESLKQNPIFLLAQTVQKKQSQSKNETDPMNSFPHQIDKTIKF